MTWTWTHPSPVDRKHPWRLSGAQLSSRLSGGFIRRALAFVLLASGLKMLDVTNQTTVVILVLALLLAPLAWMLLRRRHGLPALATSDMRRVRIAHDNAAHK